MASKVYLQSYKDGTSKLVRRVKPQGRIKGSGEGSRSRSYSASDVIESKILENAKKMNMSKSQFICLACLVYKND